MPPGYGVGDAAALHFVDTELVEVVSSRPEARARYVCSDGAGGAIERELPVRYLGQRAEVSSRRRRRWVTSRWQRDAARAGRRIGAIARADAAGAEPAGRDAGGR